MADKTQALSGLTTRQKATAGVFVLVVLFLLWQVFGMFGGSKTPAIEPAPSKTGMSASSMGPANAPMRPAAPQLADVPKQAAMTEREAELIKLQQETEAKYISALNELQMLKVSKDIAETNQAIMKAKLETITAQKGIVDLLSQQNAPQATPATYAQGLVNPASGAGQGAAPQKSAPATQEQSDYTVVSVSQLQYKWGAVLGNAGNLYNVSVGDVLPPDGSVVMTIDKTGVLLEKNGVKRKISMVPII